MLAPFAELVNSLLYYVVNVTHKPGSIHGRALSLLLDLRLYVLAPRYSAAESILCFTLAPSPSWVAKPPQVAPVQYLGPTRIQGREPTGVWFLS